MSVHIMRAATACAVLAGLTTAGFAEDSAEATPDTKALLEYVKRLESRVDELEREREWPLESFRGQSESVLESAVRSINWSGFLEVEYNYNFRHGSDIDGVRGETLGFNQLRGPDQNENTFTLQHVQLMADRPLTSVGSTGFRVRADYGYTPQYDDRDSNFDASGLFSPTDPSGVNSDLARDALELDEAYMSYRMDLAGMSQDCLTYLDLTVGKFYSPLGFETPNNTDNWVLTRNLLYTIGSPITHTGIRAELPLSECMKITGYFVNGWDNVLDANDGKTGILSVELGPYEQMKSTLTLNVSYGDEGSFLGHTGDKTQFYEAIWKANLTDDTEVAVDAFWGMTDELFDRDGSGANTTDRRWRGVAAYIRHHYSDKLWVSSRLGYHRDEFAAMDFKVVDATVAVGYELGEGLTVALEYRHDHARGSFEPYFGPNEEEIADQDTITASFLYRF